MSAAAGIVKAARAAAACRDVIDRHRPLDGARDGSRLSCAWCSDLAGLELPWPCPDRLAVGDLLPDPTNRYLPGKEVSA